MAQTSQTPAERRSAAARKAAATRKANAARSRSATAKSTAERAARTTSREAAGLAGDSARRLETVQRELGRTGGRLAEAATSRAEATSARVETVVEPVWRDVVTIPLGVATLAGDRMRRTGRIWTDLDAYRASGIDARRRLRTLLDGVPGR